MLQLKCKHFQLKRHSNEFWILNTMSASFILLWARVPLDEIKRPSSFHIRLECKQLRLLKQLPDTLQNPPPQVFQEVQIFLQKSRKFPHWPISPSVCCLSRKALFPHCSFAGKVGAFVQMSLGWCFASDSFLQESFRGTLWKMRGGVFWNCAAKALLWMVWRENRRFFKIRKLI